MSQGGVGVPRGFGTLPAPHKPGSDAPAIDRMAGALERLAAQLTNPPVTIIKPIKIIAGATQLVKSEQSRVNTLITTCTSGMFDIYYGDQQGNMQAQPHLRCQSGDTHVIPLAPNQWTFTICAGASIDGEGCVILAWTNGGG
jgi:hypothetical protein